MMVAFTVPGPQKPQGRARVLRNGHAYNPPNPWRDSIQWLAKEHFRGWDQTQKYELRVTFAGRLRGDLDNYLKALMDALQGIAWKNDKQVFQLEVLRIEGEPSTRIEVRGIHEGQTDTNLPAVRHAVASGDVGRAS